MVKFNSDLPSTNKSYLAVVSGAVPCSPPWKSQSLGETGPGLTFELVMLPASGRECMFYQRGGLGCGVVFSA